MTHLATQQALRSRWREKEHHMNTLNTNDSRRERRVERLSDKLLEVFRKTSLRLLILDLFFIKSLSAM